MILETALTCLALNIYHEARSQSLVEQLAVSQVVMNRVADSRFPSTVCEVVTQGITYKNSDKPVIHKCQFSWYCDGKSDKARQKKAWEVALRVANGVYYGNIDDIVQGSTHYHAHYVQPSWAETKTYIIRIDDHIFYRWDIERSKK